MRFILISHIFLFSLILSGCVASEAEIQKAVYGYSQQEITEIGAICRSKVMEASRRGEKDRWSKWAICEKERKMPIDIEAFNLQQDAIEPIYDRRIQRLKDLEKKYDTLSPSAFQRELNKIYDLYEREKSKSGANTCQEWSDTGDGSGSKVCTKYPEIVVFYK